MASAWLTTRVTASGNKRYRVMFRLGGRESIPRYAGSFATKRDALARTAWVIGELAAMRVPEIAALDQAPVRPPTRAEAAERWRESRIDVAEGTRVLHRIALDRVLPRLGDRRLDELTVDDINAMVAELATTGRKRETIRKSVKYLAAVLEEAGVDPNPARDRRVRLPHEEPTEIDPPTTDHVETVYRLLARPYRLPLLWLDWSGARVASVQTVSSVTTTSKLAGFGCVRRPRRRGPRSGSSFLTFSPKPLRQRSPPREDRDSNAPLFPGVSADRLRTAIARACKAAGIPVFSPHDLRHRRISLLDRQGRTWAEIGRFVGQRKLSITADTYTHVLSDGREVDLAGLFEPAR